MSRARRTRLAVFSSWFEHPGFEAEVRASASEFNLVALGTTARQILQKGTRQPDAVIIGHLEVYSPIAVLLVRRRWPNALVVVMRALRRQDEVRKTVRAGAHSWFLEKPREPQRMVLPWAVNELRFLLTEGKQDPAPYASEFEQDLTIAPPFEQLRPMGYEVLRAVAGCNGDLKTASQRAMLGRSTVRNSMCRVRRVLGVATTREAASLASMWDLADADPV